MGYEKDGLVSRTVLRADLMNAAVDESQQDQAASVQMLLHNRGSHHCNAATHTSKS